MEPVVLLILFAVFLGALSQRVTGMGFALVCGPFLVLLLDPFSGVVLVNLCGILASSVVFARTWREVEWPSFWQLALGAILGAVPGALLAASLPVPPLQILIGSLIVVSIISSLIIGHIGHTLPARPAAKLTAGLLSGAMSASAGTGGPAISAYAVLTKWEHRAFAATLQPFLIVGAGFAVVLKLSMDDNAWPELDAGTWVAIVLVLAAGLSLGEWLSKRLPVSAARVTMIVLALGGGVATLIKGFVHVV
ncbi:sulfite exporter TauE/SafE family protein [Brevibacterium sp.]|uniref:sulfite exporter TauE/SafE family protein n=1 Tax=Brevibacterium sp. TaxID=1701 RepID=UPI00281217BC|nr:sulfite exporter TauE/SafE family protein [Brevibacterium sp.]